MADKERIEKVEITESHEKKVTDKVAPLNVDEKRTGLKRNVPQWLVWVIIGAVIVLIAFIVMIMAVIHDVRDQAANQSQAGSQTTSMRREIGGRGYAGGSYYTQTSDTDGPTTTTTTTKHTYTQGVVTKVDSGSIVVAGNGKTQTITTNSSTVYDDSTKPVVNDTVIIVGTVGDDSKVTATEVLVANN